MQKCPHVGKINDGETIMRKLAIKLIRLYQKASVGKRPTCRYRPTCSSYAIQCYQNYNVFSATILTIWRILRCNPLSQGGYDPIPKVKKAERERIKG